MYKGSCLCNAVAFKLLVEPVSVSNCHCRMCQKQHGAAFATYGSVLKKNLVYLSGEDKLSSYNSSDAVIRKFCSVCGSNIEWSSLKDYTDWVSIPLATLDSGIDVDTIEELHLESKASWSNR